MRTRPAAWEQLAVDFAPRHCRGHHRRTVRSRHHADEEQQIRHLDHRVVVTVLLSPGGTSTQRHPTTSPDEQRQPIHDVRGLHRERRRRVHNPVGARRSTTSGSPSPIYSGLECRRMRRPRGLGPAVPWLSVRQFVAVGAVHTIANPPCPDGNLGMAGVAGVDWFGRQDPQWTRYRRATPADVLRAGVAAAEGRLSLLLSDFTMGPAPGGSSGRVDTRHDTGCAATAHRPCAASSSWPQCPMWKSMSRSRRLNWRRTTGLPPRTDARCDRHQDLEDALRKTLPDGGEPAAQVVKLAARPSPGSSNSKLRQQLQRLEKSSARDIDDVGYNGSPRSGARETPCAPAADGCGRYAASAGRDRRRDARPASRRSARPAPRQPVTGRAP